MAFPVTSNIVNEQPQEVKRFLIDLSFPIDENAAAKVDEFEVTSIPFARTLVEGDDTEDDGDEVATEKIDVKAPDQRVSSARWWLIQPIDFDHAIIRQHEGDKEEQIAISTCAGPRYKLMCGIASIDPSTNAKRFLGLTHRNFTC
jgi:hypothetical protein